ncbi:MAG TPA: hypothetical protein VGX23_21560 [Actinocrinis sp.]|nr:hypothetical protein [Actinocrinis sp.]
MPPGAGAAPGQAAATTGAAKTGATTPGSAAGHTLAGRARTGVRAAAGGAANGAAAGGTTHAGSSGAQAGHGADTTTTGAAATTAAPAGFHPGRADSGTTGWSKLFGSPLASQVGWLYPLVGMAIATGFWWRRRQPRTDPVRAGYLVWTGWLVTTGLGLSAGSVAHSTYVVALAPALAAIAAAGLSTYLAEWRHPSSPGRAWALPVALALTALWSWHVSAHYPMFLPWLVPGTLAVTAPAAGALTWRTLAARGARPVPARIPALAVGAGVLALLAPAAAWSLSVVDSAYAGSSGNASAGPYDSGFGGGGFSAGGGGGGAGGAPAVAAGSLRRAAAPAGMMNPFDPPATLDTVQQHLLAYLTAHRAGAKYLLATQSWSAAAPYIMSDGAWILPMGGFSGDADLPTPAQFRTLVDTGNDRYVLLSGSGFMGRGGPGLQAIAASVAKTCALVPAADYDGVTGQTAPLYHCAASEG